MVLTTYEKQRILLFQETGLSPSQILSALIAENIVTIWQTIACFISGRPSRITDWVLQLVERRTREDDETTAVQLHTLLTACGVSISLSTILCSRSLLGWTYRGSKYCQLIKSQNKHKRWHLRITWGIFIMDLRM